MSHETVMTREAREVTRDRLATLNDRAGCGDSSCLFGQRKGGQATNGGCRCMEHAGRRHVVRNLALTAQADLPRALNTIDAIESELMELKVLLRETLPYTACVQRAHVTPPEWMPVELRKRIEEASAARTCQGTGGS